MTVPTLASPAPSLQARLRRIALLARALVLVGGAVFALNALATWVFPGYAVRNITSQVDVQVLGPLTAGTRTAYMLWDLPSLALILIALYRLWQLFGQYLQSRVFSTLALTSLRGFARWVLAAAACSPIYRAGLSVIVTWQNGPGRRQLVLNLSTDDYLALLLGIVVLAISSVMVDAARIAEDNEGFV